MKLAAAARALKVALSTAALMSRTGQIDVDPETDSSGSRFVTRTSVDVCWLDRRGTRSGTIAIDEVVRYAGVPRGGITDLIRTGVLEQVTSTKELQITVSSLRIWLSTRS